MRRRAFIEGMLAGGTAVAVGQTAKAETPNVRAPGASRAGPEAPHAPLDPPGTVEEVWPLLAPLQTGDAIGLGWGVGSLAGVAQGASVLTLVHADGRTARVHLCRRGQASRAAAHSETVDLYLMNDGDGSASTDEALGRVLNVLAIVIRHNEKQGAGATEAMLSHEARLHFYRAQCLLV